MCVSYVGRQQASQPVEVVIVFYLSPHHPGTTVLMAATAEIRTEGSDDPRAPGRETRESDQPPQPRRPRPGRPAYYAPPRWAAQCPKGGGECVDRERGPRGAVLTNIVDKVP